MRQFDNSFRTHGISYICGIDEAGRGPLAGPVVAAAVVYDETHFIPGVDDSKKLTPSKREYFFTRIQETAAAYSYAVITPDEIDRLNILGATLAGMKQSLESLKVTPHKVLVDGNKLFPTALPAVAIVKGDTKSFAIASASIIAKVIRDRLMDELDDVHPVYFWKKNKGYPTRDHIAAVLKHGPSPHHRKSFLKNIDLWRNNGLFE